MQKHKFARIQSPSSINTYKQCPRKYYYQYIKDLPTRPSIHLIRGKIAHSVLEDFFKINIDNISENFDFEFKVVLHELLSKHWKASKEKLSALGMADQEINFYLDETKDMIQFWLIDFLRKLEEHPKDIKQAFLELTPITEQHFISQAHGVQGYIDAIFNINNEIQIIDYKTSNHDKINASYRLQLAIYALLYHEKHGKLPDKVGIHFLKFSEKHLKATEELLELARGECKYIHEKTQSDDIQDYPKKESGLCKWSRGQCDFFKECKN